MPHPWELTLAQFIELARRQYGFELRTLAFTVRSRDGHRSEIPYLEGASGIPFVLLPGGVDLDEPLPLDVLRSLIVRCGLPPEHFQLDSEDPSRDPE